MKIEEEECGSSYRAEESKFEGRREHEFWCNEEKSSGLSAGHRGGSIGQHDGQAAEIEELVSHIKEFSV